MLMYGKGTRMNLLFRFQCSQKPLLSCTINIKIRRSYDMKQPPRQRTIKDERDEKIGKDAKVYAFEWIIAITQVLTIMCIIKGNPYYFLALHFYCFMNLSSMRQNPSSKLELFS